MNLNLADKFAFISGGSHGIGLATALSLADEGCHIAICSRSFEKLKHAEKQIKNKGVQCLALEADVLNKEDVYNAIEAVKEQWGRLHILINNVGGGGRWGSEDIEKTPEKVWVEVYEKNVLSTVRFTTAFTPLMRKQKWGRVLAVTSIYGKEAGGRPWFNISKFAQSALMKNLALNKSLVRDGITFNSVAPGRIFIPGTGWSENADFEEFPMKRLGTAEEVADVITFLCSNKASYVNGASILIDGGQSACV